MILNIDSIGAIFGVPLHSNACNDKTNVLKFKEMLASHSNSTLRVMIFVACISSSLSVGIKDNLFQDFLSSFEKLGPGPQWAEIGGEGEIVKI